MNTTHILDGKNIAQSVQDDQRRKVQELAKDGVYPRLDIIICGDNAASHLYIRRKQKYCEELGIVCHIHEVDLNFESLEEKIYSCNVDPEVKAFFVQLPLPEKVKDRTQELLDYMDPEKDVDCLTSTSLGKVLIDPNHSRLPGTVRAIVELLHHTKVELKSSNIVIVNNTIVVGKPLSMYLTTQGATVTICNEFTKNLGEFTSKADILITATGVEGLIKSDMVKEESVIIDAGIMVAEKKISGDVDFETVKEKASWITPVPGGVGPMTIAYVVQNLIDIYSK